ncbi:mycothiol transferase [Streptomyces sp. H27-D2]|uniref:mycothiol transferase n=1 Tax=Streptomyces sp. H27-D2 TaxID=3046304 RepID=UPI002DBB1EB7|nr:DUF664 domain-containing protein [Streptomyces sp. H27-D2]MEC4018096.1 DUF664 domain-containing protein [Streptomyces sp. H27-D2]
MSDQPARWSRAAVYPDMWSNPDDGPRNSEGAVAEQAEVDAAYSALAREQAAADTALAEHPDLSERLGKDGIAARELMVHRIEGYARHCGHADLLRECVDGRVGQ